MLPWRRFSAVGSPSGDTTVSSAATKQLPRDKRLASSILTFAQGEAVID